MHARNWPWLAVLFALPVAAAAAELREPRYNSVEFQAEAQREVPNDLLNATLYIELNDANPAPLANALNRAVNEALRVANEHRNVRVRSGNHQSFPVYAKGNVLQGWRGRAEIRVESGDFEAASALIGRLQASMQLGGMTFSVSPETRRKVENELISEAITAFRSRADIVQAALSGGAYRIQRLTVAAGRSGPPPRFAAMRGAAVAAEVAPPVFEGGASLVTVTASGMIEVIEK